MSNTEKSNKEERAEYLAQKLKIPHDEAIILVENMEAQANV